MRNFEQIQSELGDLPDYLRMYLLGTTGAGKTSIVKQILGTFSNNFPTVTPSRTTVAPTEYVLSKNLPFKATFLFKSESDIQTSVNEILQASFVKFYESQASEELNTEIIDRLGETPDERFRLKYLLGESYIEKLAEEIIEFLSTIKKDDNTPIEIHLENEILQSELSHYISTLMKKVKEKSKELDDSFTIFEDTIYTYIPEKQNKIEFIDKIKKLLKSEDGSISPLVEYARIQGPLLAKWIEDDIEIVLIDGEGIGHNMREGSELSERHLDYFNFVDSILLVERADNPFLSGGLSAIQKIALDGYEDKFSLLFSKMDLLELKDPKRALNINNLINSLKAKKIDFSIKQNQKFYLSGINNKTISENLQKEFLKLFKTLKARKNEKPDTKILKYDFDNLFSTLDGDSFFKEWNTTLQNEHWAIVKAFNRRLVKNEYEYRYLKPISQFHTYIMNDLNLFLKEGRGLEALTYNSINAIKQKFSPILMKYLKEIMSEEAHFDLEKALSVSGKGSSKIRKDMLYVIFTSVLPSVNQKQLFKKFKNFTIENLLQNGVQKQSQTNKIEIKTVTIKNLFKRYNFQYDLNSYINILIGKNGTGKSTILKLIYSALQNNETMLEKIGKPIVEIELQKSYEDGSKKTIELNLSESKYMIDVEYIDTFDTNTKINNDNGNTELDNKLLKKVDEFSNFLNELESKLKEKEVVLEDEFKELMEDENLDPLEFKSAIKRNKEKKENLEQEIFKNIEIFKTVINELFTSTDKSLIILDNGKMAVKINDENLELHYLSSGEKQILFILLSVLLKDDAPYILLMDEPEISLHVAWQTSLLNNIQKLNANVQVIVVTHNPLIVLGRKAEEISTLIQNNIKMETLRKDILSESYDVSTLLLTYFELESLVDEKMQEKIKRFTRLKLKEDALNPEETKILNEIEKYLAHTPASNFIYNRQYLQFMKWVQDNKQINFNKSTTLDDNEMSELLVEYADLFE